MRRRWQGPLTAILVFAAPCAAFAQPTFLKPAPDATPALPPPAPAPPKPKKPAPAPPAAKSPAPAPNASKPKPPPPKADEPKAAPAAPVTHPHKAVPRPKPVAHASPPTPVAPPPRPSVVEGRIQISEADGGFLVQGQRVALTGLQLRPSPDFASRFQGWLDRSGGTVRCAPQGDAFKCSTPYGADIGAALVISGFALPTPDAPDIYKALARHLQLRAQILGYAPSPALTSLLAGTANPSCQNLVCGTRYMTVAWRRNNDAYARQDWKALVESIVSVNYRNDIDFFYLGRAAEEMGAYSAAAIYYQRAVALAQSPNVNDRCNAASGDVCGGIDVLATINKKLPAEMQISGFQF